MIRKVLIALDYDPAAQRVAEAGFSLAQSTGATITLLHVISDATYYSSVQYSPIMGFDHFGAAGLLQKETMEEIKTAALQFLDKTREHLGDKSIQTLVMEGDFAEAILDAAGDNQADVIVMGTHGRRGLDKILMGSVAEKVLRSSQVPLFIVPTRTP